MNEMNNQRNPFTVPGKRQLATEFETKNVSDRVLFGNEYVEEYEKASSVAEKNLKTIEAAINNQEDDYFATRNLRLMLAYKNLIQNYANTKEYVKAKELISNLADHYDDLSRYFRNIEDEIKNIESIAFENGNHEEIEKSINQRIEEKMNEIN